MMQTVMVIVFMIMCGILMWYPGFLMAYNMTVAMTGEKPSIGTIIGAMIPGVNVGITRKQLYGTAKLVWFSLGALCVTMVIKLSLFYFFNTALGILLSLIFTFILWGVMVITWLIQGYVLWDTCTMIQEGIVVKILGFVIPPLACYFIGRDCIPRVRASVAEIEREEQEREDWDYYDE